MFHDIKFIHSALLDQGYRSTSYMELNISVIDTDINIMHAKSQPTHSYKNKNKNNNNKNKFISQNMTMIIT